MPLFRRPLNLLPLSAVCALLLLLTACERPPVEPVQGGYRGTGMVQIYNPRILAEQASLNAEPDIARAARLRENAPLAGDVYENIQVLGDLSLAEFGRTMTAITTWVAPEGGCLYCHEEGNLASDAKYQKQVARRMFQMVQHMNATWTDHVGKVGVTCYTCHRGHPVPQNVWYQPTPDGKPGAMMGKRHGQNAPGRLTGNASLPNDPFSIYLLGAENIRVQSTTALPSTPADGAQHKGVKDAEKTYGFMMHISKALGVNCSFCHNTRAFSSWKESSPQRLTAWHGIRLARDLNQQFLTADPLLHLFPANRRGPMGDVAKVNCATCHQGAYKPLYGSHLAKYYPAVLPGDMRPKVPPGPPPAPQIYPAVRAERGVSGGQP